MPCNHIGKRTADVSSTLWIATPLERPNWWVGVFWFQRFRVMCTLIVFSKVHGMATPIASGCGNHLFSWFPLKLAKLEEFQNLNQNRQGDSIGTISGKSGSWHVMLPKKSINIVPHSTPSSSHTTDAVYHSSVQVVFPSKDGPPGFQDCFTIFALRIPISTYRVGR